MIIAIDGPAASGKGTIARQIAAIYGLHYLDTGLLYRAVAKAVLDGGHSPDDAERATEAAVMLDPSVTVLQGSHPDLRILSDTRTQKDTLEVFGGEYPGGALYSTTAWVNSHEKDVQALASAMLNTLAWIHSHSAEDIMAKMPPEIVGKNKELYLAALKNTIPMFSESGKMDPKGAEAVLAVFSESSPEVAKANIDVTKTWTNKYVDQAKKTTGMNAK